MTREEAKAFAERVIDLGFKDETQEFCEFVLKLLEQEPCEDAISIEEAIHCLEQFVTDMPQLKLYAQKVADAISDLPSVYQKSKTGHWIKEPMDLVRCSKCGYKGVRRLANNYCPNCGAKMEEELQWFDIA